MKQFKITEKITPRTTKSAMLYFSEVEKTVVLDPETENEIAKLAAKGDREARQKLVMANLRFVLSVAKLYSSKPEDYIDLVSAGNEGLIEASEKFDPSRGFKFISFAIWYIRKEMIKFLAEHSRTIKIPPNQTATIRAILDAGNRISMREGREVSNEEALEYLRENDPKYRGAETKFISNALLADKRPASLEFEMREESGSGTLLDIIESDEDKTDEPTLNKNKKDSIRILLSCLNEQERNLVILHFGLSHPAHLGESVQTLAKKFNCSIEGVRLRLRKAIQKMKIFSKKMGLRKPDF